MLPVRPDDASRYGWRTRLAVLRTPHRRWRFARPWVPPEGAATSGVQHVNNEGEPADRDPGAVRHGDDRGRLLQVAGVPGEPQ
ncbi:MAG: hypothetical protein ACRDRR_23685 [Pseudonocardiaceae bacterium]